MVGRLAGETGIVFGAGQTADETIGNGRAITLRFAEEGAAVVRLDRTLNRRRRASPMRRGSLMAACTGVINAAVARRVRLDRVINVEVCGGDDSLAYLALKQTWARVTGVNLKVPSVLIHQVVLVIGGGGQRHCQDFAAGVARGRRPGASTFPRRA